MDTGICMVVIIPGIVTGPNRFSGPSESIAAPQCLSFAIVLKVQQGSLSIINCS